MLKLLTLVRLDGRPGNHSDRPLTISFLGGLLTLSRHSSAGVCSDADAPGKPAQPFVGKMRIEWVDAAKGFGIILVVLSHELRGLMHAEIVSDAGALRLADRWIYSFHMPLFFFLAGLFVPKSLDRWSQLETFLQGKFATIVYPYFVWSILTIALKSCLGSIPHTPRELSDIFQIIYAPVEQYWFLYALFLIFVAFALARRLGLSTTTITCLSVIVWLFPISTHWLILNVAIFELLYFAIGALMTRFSAENDSLFESPIFLVVALTTSLVSFGTDCQPLAALAGICFSVALVQILPQEFSRPLAFLGRYALEIYLAHSIVSAAARVLLLHIGIKEPSIHLAMGLIAGICIPLALGYASRKHVPFVFVLKTRGY